MRYIAALIAVLALLLVSGLNALALEGQEPLEPPAADGSPQPSHEPEPSPAVTPEPEAAKLFIDNRNLYENMSKTYSQGYIPTVRDGTATIVLPLLCRGELRGDSIRAKAVFDPGGPFVTKNYEQTVELREHKVNGGKQKVRGYCISLPMQLERGRMNGSYPVTIAVTGTEPTGREVEEEFTVYVTVTDGRDPNATPKPEPAPTPEPAPPVVLGPKVLVQSSQAVSLEAEAQPGVVNAGDRIRVTITLVNTSQSQAIENLAVTAASPGEGFSVLSPSDSAYIGTMPAGGTADIIYDYQVSPETPAGQYTIPLAYDFAYNKGETGSGAGSARVNISQPLKLEFSLGSLPAEAVVSDTVEVNVQAINLSHAKAYNVRATFEGDGLLPSGTAFIGSLEGGASGEKPLQVTITGLTNGEAPYGPTECKVTYIYEDGSGQELTETGSFTINIKSPFSEEGPKEEDAPGQFWIVLAGAGAALLGLTALLIIRGIRRRRA